MGWVSIGIMLLCASWLVWSSMMISRLKGVTQFSLILVLVASSYIERVGLMFLLIFKGLKGLLFRLFQLHWLSVYKCWFILLEWLVSETILFCRCSTSTLANKFLRLLFLLKASPPFRIDLALHWIGNSLLFSLPWIYRNISVENLWISISPWRWWLCHSQIIRVANIISIDSTYLLSLFFRSN